jgi:hypothetical protein
MKRNRRLAVLSLALSLAGISLLSGIASSGCSAPRGRIMGEEEEGLVGYRAAGAETYDRLVEGTVGKLLDRVSASNRGLAKLRVAFLALENKTSEPLGSFHDQITELIDTSINNSERFQTISSRFVEAGLRESRLRRDDLFIPRHQRTFKEVLEQSGHPVECLLFGTLTSGTTRGGSDIKQVDYMLTLELIDIETGTNQKDSVRLRKEYEK